MGSAEIRNGAARDARPVRKMLILAVILAIVWLLWSGFFKPLLIGLGVFSCLLTVYLVSRMQSFREDAFRFPYGLGLLVYWAWLFKEIVLSSLAVAKIVLARDIDVSPEVVGLNAANLDTFSQVMLGNSITLTPGTLTLDVHRDRILVHALTSEGAANLEAGEMQRRVAALSGD